ncbi:MAG: hypothetical protein K940chlam9_00380 [Chlamydiae bacterium]|nr:hypothetical protein [Chlamydiota bacterium]
MSQPDDFSDEPNGYSFTDDAMEGDLFSLTDELDHQILMHRDAHFGGDFQVMIRYYEEEGVGTQPDFELDRIAYLVQVEQELGQDLAALMLTAPEAEQVARARSTYQQLKEIYSIEEEKSPFPRLLADLILTEEEEPIREMEAVVAHGKRIVPELLNLLKTEEVYDPLFPGYGLAPALAAHCLGEIGGEEAVIPLFEMLGKKCVFEEEAILSAFVSLGDTARDFLIQQIQSRPLTQDTVHAAFALTAFAEELDVARLALKTLQDPEVQSKPVLRSYLLHSCEVLRDHPEKEVLLELADNPTLLSSFREEILSFTHHW